MTEEEERMLELQRQEWCRTNMLGQFAPKVAIESLVIPPRGPTEPLATEKQVTYLKGLGVKDDAWLLGLGKKQASAAIENILRWQDEIRDEAEAVWESVAAQPAPKPAYFKPAPEQNRSFWQRLRRFLS
jgi:hypothetical protein